MKKRGGLNQHYICQGCKESFGTQRIPRLLPICGHTLCQNCIEQKMEDTENGKVILKCVVDGKVMEFQERQLSNFPKNFAMLKTIEKRQLKPAPPKIQEQTIPVSQKMQQLQQTKSQESNLNLIAQQKQQKPKSKQEEQDQLIEQSKQQECQISKKQIQSEKSLTVQEMCLIHSRPLEIVCLKQSVLICSNCALFGEHRNHQVKSLADIKKDIILKQQQFLQVIDEKEQMESQFFKSIGDEEIQRLIFDKKDILYKQIKEQFDKMLKRLRQQQRKMYANLQEVVKRMQKNFKQDAQKANKKFLQFRDWQRTALDFINTLEGQNLQKKLVILDYQNSKSKIDPIQQGYRIIDETTKTKNQVLTGWDQVLCNFQIDFKPAQIQTFIGLFEVKYPQANKKEQIIPTIQSQKYLNENTRQSQPLYYSSSNGNINQQYNSKNFCSNDDLLLEMEYSSPNHNIPHLEFDMSMNMDYIGQLPDISKIQHRQPSFYVQTTPFDYRPTPVPKSPSAISGRINEPKKKLKPVKVPPKYQKVMQSLMTDSLDVLDFTNSQLGNQDIISILQHMKNKKVKTVKLIRCKLSDDILNELWNSMSKVISLNLSQNTFSDRVIDSFLDNIYKMPNLRTLTLSQNKINQRNVKNRIEQARKMEVIISL